MDIKSQLRGNDIFARYGGEEFVVLLPNTTLRHACEIAERIRSTIAAQPQPISENLTVTISIGVAIVPEKLEEDDRTVAQKLLCSADEALYLTKESGRNRVVSEEALGITIY